MGDDVYHEIFESPFGCSTKEQAEFVLDTIRKSHSEKDGWIEVKSGVKKRKGKWYAWRQHCQSERFKTFS